MNKIKDLPLNERPIERLINENAKNLSTEELLAILIKTGTTKYSSKDLALKILKDIDNINELSDININTLIKIDGIGQVKAATIIAAIELGKRINKSINNIKNITFNNPEIVFNYYKDIIGNKKQEYFYCIYLDNAKKIIKDKLLFIGTINKSLVHPREIFKEAYLLSASFIICVHNHPTNNVLPSKEDLNITSLLIQNSKILGIPVIDHIIIGNTKYYSMYENNDLGDL